MSSTLYTNAIYMYPASYNDFFDYICSETHVCYVVSEGKERIASEGVGRLISELKQTATNHPHVYGGSGFIY